jgi:protein unc-45
MATTTTVSPPAGQPPLSKEDQTQLLIARLMEGGQEDDETCRDLDQLTGLLNEDFKETEANANHPSICRVIDDDCLDTILTYLDMRQPEVVRGHATVTVSAYLKAGREEGAKSVSKFFADRVRRGTYDDYIVAFCVAASMFPIQPDLTSQLFLSEGFLGSLGPLMRRKWKSRKVETACLEMLNAACMISTCREAVDKYCSEWLEQVVDQDPNQVTQEAMAADMQISLNHGSVSMRTHSMQVQRLAAVILAKLHVSIPTRRPRTPCVRSD